MGTVPEIEGLAQWRPLARGGLAVVWEARQLCLDRLVAVKVYQRDPLDAGRHHHARETAAAGKLAVHPGIVTVHDAGTLPGGRPYLLMDLCPGGSLTRWLEPDHRPSAERVRQVGLRIAGALAAAHAAGVVHRDVKPANILIDSTGHPRLADFGLALERGASPDPSDARWMTAAWAPPEAFHEQPATEAGDVYSLAATLYALLAGRSPHVDGGAVPGAGRADLQPVRPIPGVSESLMGVLSTALATEPAARPDASGFYAQLATASLHTLSTSAFVRGATPAPVATASGTWAGIGQPAAPTGRVLGAGGLTAHPARHQVGGEATAPPRWLRAAPARALTLAAALATVLAFGSAWVVRGPGAPLDLATAADAPLATGSTDTWSTRPSDSDLSTFVRAGGSDHQVVRMSAGAAAQSRRSADSAGLTGTIRTGSGQPLPGGAPQVQDPAPSTPEVPPPSTGGGQPRPTPVVKPDKPAPPHGGGSTPGQGNGQGGHGPGKGQNGNGPGKGQNGNGPGKSQNGNGPGKSQNGNGPGKSQSGNGPGKSQGNGGKSQGNGGKGQGAGKTQGQGGTSQSGGTSQGQPRGGEGKGHGTGNGQGSAQSEGHGQRDAGKAQGGSGGGSDRDGKAGKGGKAQGGGKSGNDKGGKSEG